MKFSVVTPALVAAIGFQISACQTVGTSKSNFGPFGKFCTSQIDVDISKSFVENNLVFTNSRELDKNKIDDSAKQILIERYKNKLENVMRYEFQKQLGSEYGKCQSGDRNIRAIIEVRGVPKKILHKQGTKKFWMSIKLIEDSSGAKIGTINTEFEINEQKVRN